MICLCALLRGLFFFGCFMVGSQAVAADLDPINPDSALVATLATIEGTPLRLQEAEDAALAQAASVLIARSELDAARAIVVREQGSYDPGVFLSVIRSGNDVPSSSPFSGAPVLEQDQTSAQTGVRVQLPIGTQLEASVSAIRLESNSNFSSLNPQYTTTGGIRVRQPLLSGFGFSARKNLTAAERGMAVAQARYDDAVLRMRAVVAQLYWDLYTAERDLAVQYLVRNQAEALLKEALLRARSGLVGPNQVANAQVFLAEQEQVLLDRQEALDRASDRLSVLMGQRPSTVRFRPVDEPAQALDLKSLDQVLADALDANLQLQAERADIGRLKALLRAANRDRLPTLDLVGALGGNGLSGTGQNVIFGADTLRSTQSGGYGDALGQILKRDNPTYEVGLLLDIPIGAHTGRGESDRLRAEAARAEYNYAAAQRDLEAQVRDQYRAVAHGKQRLSLARSGVDAASEQVRIGVIEYRNGRSTAFELVRLAADFAAAQQRYSQALVRMAKAESQLRYLTSGQHPQ